MEFVSTSEKNKYQRQILAWVGSKKPKTPAPSAAPVKAVAPESKVGPKVEPKVVEQAPKPEWMQISDKNRPGRLAYWNSLQARHGMGRHDDENKRRSDFRNGLMTRSDFDANQISQIFSTALKMKDKSEMDVFLSGLGLNTSQISNVNILMKNNNIGYYAQSGAILNKEEESYWRKARRGMQQDKLSKDDYAMKLANLGYSTSEIEEIMPGQWTQKRYDTETERSRTFDLRRQGRLDAKPELQAIDLWYKSELSKLSRHTDRNRRNQASKELRAERSRRQGEVKARFGFA